jgi:hypothetical protein
LKTKNGKNFVVEEQHQPCLFFNVLHDLVIGNEQKFTTFCDKMQNHFNETCPIDYALRLKGLWKQNEVSSNKIFPSSKETTLLCFFFVNQGHGLKMHFKSFRFVQTKTPKV